MVDEALDRATRVFLALLVLAPTAFIAWNLLPELTIPVPSVNETHYIARLKHYWNPAWCKGDLFLESVDTQVVFIWLFGWLTFWYLAIAAVAVDNALASQALMPLLGISDNEDTARLITIAVLIVQAALVIASTRLLGLITSGAVGLELGIVLILVLVLGIVMAVTGSGHVDNLTSRGITAGAGDYYAVGGGLMAGMIMGLTTLVGFDSAANLAEEAKDPFRSVPRAIVASVVAAGVARRAAAFIGWLR